jgi:hypothetical protein
MALLDHEGDHEPASASSSGRFRHESLPAYLAGADRLYRPGNDNHTRRGPATSAELDCLRGVLPSGLLEAAS